MKFRQALACAALAALCAPSAAARPGGGQSFHSSSSYHPSSSSRSSSSWSSSGSSRSSSSWGSSGSSRSSSSWSTNTPSDPSRYDSPYFGSPRARQDVAASREEQRDMAHARCVAACEGADSAALERCIRSCDRQYAPPSLTRRYWLFGAMLGLVALIGGARIAQKRRSEQAWESAARDVEREATFRQEADAARTRYPNVAAALAALKSQDAAFSSIVLEDFLHALYVEVQHARAGGKLELLAPYLSRAAIDALGAYPADEVNAVIVGSLEIADVSVDENARAVRIRVGFESNYTERRSGDEQSYYVRETWILRRGADVRSRPPERARVVGCANCGAPLDKLLGKACEFCGAPAGLGQSDWAVDAIGIDARELRGPLLTGTTQEEGTDLPTLVAPDAQEAFAALSQADPSFSWARFTERVGVVFQTFHRAWSARDLTPMRAFMSDNLFETQCYWTNTYTLQGLTNITENPTIVSLALSRVVRDAFFDALTLRIFAECIDYTIDATGNIVGGSRSQVRRYSEYWTFIRASAKDGAQSCPNCGAPLGTIAVAGNCQSCGAKLERADFDFVLSRIEQDEVYRL